MPDEYGYPHATAFGFESLLAYMTKHGSSVVLNWGEDTEVWECSWITDGRRYSGFRKEAHDAAREAYYNARAANEAMADA